MTARLNRRLKTLDRDDVYFYTCVNQTEVHSYRNLILAEEM